MSAPNLGGPPEVPNIAVSSSTTAIQEDFARFVRDMQAGRVIYISDVGYTVAPAGAVRLLADEDSEAEAEDMVSLRGDKTGVDNTIFVSTRGYAQHAPRIKIAIDPPDALNARSKSASMAIHDYGMTGAYAPPHVVEQAKQFIERNRDVLLKYWDCEIDTAELIRRLKAP